MLTTVVRFTILHRPSKRLSSRLHLLLLKAFAVSVLTGRGVMVTVAARAGVLRSPFSGRLRSYPLTRGLLLGWVLSATWGLANPAGDIRGSTIGHLGVRRPGRWRSYPLTLGASSVLQDRQSPGAGPAAEQRFLFQTIQPIPLAVPWLWLSRSQRFPRLFPDQISGQPYSCLID